MLDDALLWKVSSSNTGHNSYIFGTIHLHTSSYDAWVNVLESIATEVQTIYTEAPLNAHLDQSIYMLPDGASLNDHMSDRKYHKLKNIVDKAFQFDLEGMSRYLPLIVVQQLAMTVAKAQNMPSIDMAIYQLSKRLDLNYKGVESTEEQQEILRNMPLEYQLKSLLKVSKNVKKFRKSILRLIDLYNNQEISKLYKYSKKEMGDVKKLLLYDRNEVFATRIIANHSVEPSLFTFGSGHLAGNKGVLALLKRKGMKIKAIKTSI